MRALAYQNAHPVGEFAIKVMDIPDPEMRPTDILIEIRAVGVNPGEAMFRGTRSAEAGGRVILGWEFAGVVVEAGPSTSGYQAGDRVFGTGDLLRDGCWSELAAIDYRVVGHAPESMSFTDAASLPIGSLTAWESVFREGDELPSNTNRVLVVGGAGGVGSMAIQLLKARSKAFVIATASREDSNSWCKELGADLVVDHSKDVGSQLRNAGIPDVDMVLSTKGTAKHVGWIPELLRPYGHLSSCDISGPFDASPLFMKSQSLHLEMVFAKGMNGFKQGSQSPVLEAVATLANHGRIHPITKTLLHGFKAESMRTAHELIESGRSIGKIVIGF